MNDFRPVWRSRRRLCERLDSQSASSTLRHGRTQTNHMSALGLLQKFSHEGVWVGLHTKPLVNVSMWWNVSLVFLSNVLRAFLFWGSGDKWTRPLLKVSSSSYKHVEKTFAGLDALHNFHDAEIKGSAQREQNFDLGSWTGNKHRPSCSVLLHTDSGLHRKKVSEFCWKTSNGALWLSGYTSGSKI